MKLLVIRRDNIGDLVCTTSLFSALRGRFPDAWIGALVNSYNAPVLEGNDDLSEVVVYTKLKHLDEDRSAFAALRERVGSLWRLRRMQLDYVVLATSDFVPRTARLARWLAPKTVAGFSDGSARAARSLDASVPVAELAGRHEVERVFALGRLFGIEGAPPPLKVVPNGRELAAAQAKIGTRSPRVAVHISARRPAQRWPAERFISLIERLKTRFGATVVLLWSPGPTNHARHPGDDDKAMAIAGKASVVAYPTARLQELIGAMAACNAVICSDGGASHIAAALGKPIVCFFGDSPVERWRPWGVPQRIVQPKSRNVRDLQPEEVFDAFWALAEETRLTASA